jgi:hypothetical protein
MSGSSPFSFRLVGSEAFPVEQDAKHAAHAAHAYDPSVLDACPTPPLWMPELHLNLPDRALYGGRSRFLATLGMTSATRTFS